MSAAVFPVPQRRADVTMVDVFKKLQSPNAKAHRYPAPDRNLRGWTESKLPGRFRVCPRIHNHFLAQEPSVDMLQEARSLGAPRYVAKNSGAAELVAAVEQVPGA
jgi:hypothetical protein